MSDDCNHDKSLSRQQSFTDDVDPESRDPIPKQVFKPYLAYSKEQE